MINVNLATGHVIAGDSTSLFEAADNALLSGARLTVSILEASIEARLDPRTKQKLLESLNAGQSRLVESRKNFTSVHSQLVVLQRKTNLAEVSWGCGDVDKHLLMEASHLSHGRSTANAAERKSASPSL